MKIKNVVLSKSYTGFYFDDQKAIKLGAGHDGFMYLGAPATEGFSGVRQTGEAISIQLVLEDGSIGYGDCAAVQYSGAGGRDPLFLASDFIPFLEKNIVPMLIGEDVSTIEDVYEPYLMQIGFLSRTPRGRVVTPLAYKHFGIPYENKGE